MEKKYVFEKIIQFNDIANDILDAHKGKGYYITCYEDIAILPKNTMDIIANLFTELYDDYRYMAYAEYIDVIAHLSAEKILKQGNQELVDYLLRNKISYFFEKNCIDERTTIKELAQFVLEDFLKEVVYTSPVFDYLNIRLAKHVIGKDCCWSNLNVIKSVKYVIDTYEFETSPQDYISHLITVINEGCTRNIKVSINLNVNFDISKINEKELKQSISHKLGTSFCEIVGVEGIAFTLKTLK